MYGTVSYRRYGIDACHQFLTRCTKPLASSSQVAFSTKPPNTFVWSRCGRRPLARRLPRMVRRTRTSVVRIDPED